MLDFSPDRARVHVWVVDNASGDGTAEMVTTEFESVLVLKSDVNLGFGAANNIAISKGHAPYVLLLNPDTELRPDTIERLISLMETSPAVGICGPKLVRPNGSFDHASKRSFPTPVGALAHFAGIGRHRLAPKALAQYRAPGLNPDSAGPVDAVNGAFMLIRRELIEQVGGFDEGFWMYMEDLDFCFRASEEGWQVFYEPAAIAIHHKSGSAGPVRSARLTRAFHYGMFRFYRKHYASDRSALVNGVIYAAIGVKLAAALAALPVRKALTPGRQTGRD